MKPFGSRRTYAKCIVLRVKAGQARDFKLTLKNRKTERQKNKQDCKKIAKLKLVLQFF